MYNPDNRQYIFRESSGKVWNFFYDEKYGICYSILSKRNTWSEPVCIQKNTYPCFFVDVDYEDCFHILFQDKQGNVFYSFLSSSGIKTVPVLNSKSPSAYNKHLFLVPFKNYAQIFFVVEHNNSMILAQQTLINGLISTPKVIDYVIGNKHPYTVASDKSGNIYVFYQSSDGKNLQIGYKKFISAQKYWGEFTPITRFPVSSEFPRAITDSKDVMHICYHRRMGKQYELIYQQKIPDKNLWSNESIIHTSSFPFTSFSVLYCNQNIIVFWIREDIVYYSSSSDNGSTWSRPSRYSFTSGKQLVCLRYKTNSPYEAGKIASSDVPGNFINGFNLAFYRPQSDDYDNISAEDLKTMIVDSLKLLKGSIEELKESYSGIKDSISNLSLAHQSLEREMVKHSVKMSMLESEISNIKQMYSERLNSYRESNKNSDTRPGGFPLNPKPADSSLVSDISCNDTSNNSNTDTQDSCYNLKKDFVSRKFKRLPGSPGNKTISGD
ncbi:MAG: FHA domain-containing protein [Clostridia bacterium]|nr:FHA domain-containing protein [Clostridia bacterium]